MKRFEVVENNDKNILQQKKKLPRNGISERDKAVINYLQNEATLLLLKLIKEELLLVWTYKNNKAKPINNLKTRTFIKN